MIGKSSWPSNPENPDRPMTSLPFSFDLAISIEDPAWQDLLPDLHDRANLVTQAALAALCREFGLKSAPGNATPTVEISLLFTSDAAIRRLNRDYRGKDSPTNVLSFPGNPLEAEDLEQAARIGEPLLLGDIVMARETLLREAEEQRKRLTDHMAHLLVHGVLHLAGFDHIYENEAEEMENLEIIILRHLHIANPYEIYDPSPQETPDKK